MIDTHAHIYSEYYDDIDALVNELKSNNVNAVINASTNNKDALEVIELSKKYSDFLYPVIGIHPEEIDNYDLNKIEDLIINNKIYGIGEIGLDYYYRKDNKDEQKDLFIKQIELAIKYNLPIIVHTRDSIQDCLDILKKYKVKGIIHCFSGSKEIAKEIVYDINSNLLKWLKETKEIIERKTNQINKINTITKTLNAWKTETRDDILNLLVQIEDFFLEIDSNWIKNSKWLQSVIQSYISLNKKINREPNAEWNKVIDEYNKITKQ